MAIEKLKGKFSFFLGLFESYDNPTVNRSSLAANCLSQVLLSKVGASSQGISLSDLIDVKMRLLRG